MMIKKHEQEAFDKIVEVFALSKESKKRFYNAINNPSLIIPEKYQDLLTEENDYRYVIKENINNLKFDSLQNALDHILFQNYIDRYLSKSKYTSADKLLNYKIVISKNIKDFIFCSSTGGFSSCLSLSSDYHRSAWTGLLSVFMQKSRVILMIVKDLNDTVTKYGLKTVKIRARAWAFNFGDALFYSRLYGDKALFIEKLLFADDVRMGTLVDAYATNFSMRVQETIPMLYDIRGRVLAPYFDIEKMSFSEGKFQMKALTPYNSSEDNFLLYSDGTSFDEIYKHKKYKNIAEFNDAKIAADEEWNTSCTLCGYRYETKPENILVVNDEFMYVCPNCKRKLYKVGSSYYTKNYATIAFSNILQSHNLGNGLYKSDYVPEQALSFPDLKDMPLYVQLVALENKILNIPPIIINSGAQSVILPERNIKIIITEEEKIKAQKNINIPEDKKVNNSRDKNVVLVLDINNNMLFKFYLLKDNKIALENTIGGLKDNYGEDILHGDILVSFAYLVSALQNVSVNYVLNIGYDQIYPALFPVPEEYYISYVHTEKHSQMGVMKKRINEFYKNSTNYVSYGVICVPRYGEF